MYQFDSAFSIYSFYDFQFAIQLVNNWSDVDNSKRTFNIFVVESMTDSKGYDNSSQGKYQESFHEKYR